MYRPAEAVPDEIPRIPWAPVLLAFGIPDFDPLKGEWLTGLDGRVTVIWDKQGWLSRTRDAREILRRDALRRIYLANEDEAVEDTQARSFDEAMTIQPTQGFDVSVIKRGETGVIVIENILGKVSCTPIPAFPANNSSTVGSGDVFAGAFAARLALGDSAAAAAKWGCAAAAVSLRAGQNLLTAEAYTQVCDLISSYG